MQLKKFLGKNTYGIIICNDETGYIPRLVSKEPSTYDTEKEAIDAFCDEVSSWIAYYLQTPSVNEKINGLDNMEYLKQANWGDNYVAIVHTTKERLLHVYTTDEFKFVRILEDGL